MPADIDARIKITERDLTKTTLTCINFEKNIWINRGFPRNENTGLVDREIMRNLSGAPYVFKVDSLKLFDDNHVDGVELHDVMVIFMHGGRENGGQWMFSSIVDGYPVVETVTEVNEYLRKNGEPPVEVVMACNKSPESMVKIGDFGVDKNVVYAVGETVTLLNAGMGETGKINFRAKASDFWNLDSLKTRQEVTLL